MSGTTTTLRNHRVSIVFAAVFFAVVLLFVTACSSSGEDSSDEDGDGDTTASGSIQVFAAASLNNVGEELADAFTEENDGAGVEYNFAGSSALVQQIEQGADADLFISADQENMDAALELDEFADADPQVVATNLLVLATAPGNPAGIESLDDLKDDGSAQDARIAVCADGVPCGTLANEVLDDEGIALDSPTEEANVSDVATKVSTGEVDAGFIYSTDALALQENAGDGDDEAINVVDIDDVEPNEYPAALTTTGQDNDTAAAFLEWLSTDTAREILEKYGFGAV
ncbi:MAG: molybdate ABC transporter substrate-binding protein [Mycobacteriaceae bacterium]|uniref:molybdate ABC transporter substrate-binding protein n=1 Tax=Corynebacterium sp. TaxID=1720 RepID=UPI003F9813F0